MMRRMMAYGAIALAAVMAAHPAQAQVADARELVAGQVATGAPAKAAKPDIYYFTGEAGAKLTFALSSEAATRLVLYTPTGEEMLTAGGDGAVTLEAVLPFSDAYTFAVIRRDAAQPYTLFMTVTQPTLAEAMLAYGVGYERQEGTILRRCWIKPGAVSRTTYPRDDRRRPYENRLGSDSLSISTASRDKDGVYQASYTTRYRIEGAELIVGMRHSDGEEAADMRSAFPPEFFGLASMGSPAPIYTGYHCAP
jgi:hypothetical protein